MANWYYYNENGEKISVTGKQLKELAKAGMIAPDTLIETEDGKKGRAGKINGLTFPTSPLQTPAVTEKRSPASSPPVMSKPLAVAVNSTTITAKSFCCDACGTPLKIPKNSKGHVQCPSCRNDCVLEGLIRNAEIIAKANIESGVPLTATPAVIHRQLVSLFSIAADIPPDVFDKAEVIREEHYCVPAYHFDCNGIETFTYDVANIRQHKTTQDLGDRSRTEWENYEEWDNGKSSTAAVRAAMFVSGNRKMASLINRLYFKYDPNKLVDIEELEFPPDVETCNPDFPLTAAFNEFAVPVVEKLLKIKAEETIAKQKTRDLQMGGANIQKETVRVFLGLYRIVCVYGGQEYSIWLTGDGRDNLYDELPNDAGKQQAVIEQQKVDITKLEASLTPAKSAAWIIVALIGCLIAAAFSFGSSILLGLLFIVLAIGCGIGFYFANEHVKDANDQIAQINAPLEKQITEAKENLVVLEGQWASTIRAFKERKKPLRGIYESEVAGNPEAF